MCSAYRTVAFLAGLAGLAFQLFERVVDRLRSEEFSTAPVLSVAALLLLGPPAYWSFRAHPHELSYYNGLVGGLPGAQRLGFEPTYWYDAVTPGVLNELNDPERGLPIGGTRRARTRAHVGSFRRWRSKPFGVRARW